MTDRHTHQYVRAGHGDLAVSAELITSVDARDGARIVVHAKAGHVAPGVRGELIDAVLDLSESRSSGDFTATVPLGDAESLLRLRERCVDFTVHAAGSSAIVDARLSPQ